MNVMFRFILIDVGIIVSGWLVFLLFVGILIREILGVMFYS